MTVQQIVLIHFAHRDGDRGGDRGGQPSVHRDRYYSPRLVYRNLNRKLFGATVGRVCHSTEDSV